MVPTRRPKAAAGKIKASFGYGGKEFSSLHQVGKIHVLVNYGDREDDGFVYKWIKIRELAGRSLVFVRP